MHKECTSCNITKPLSEFYKNSKGKFKTSQMCKECSKIWAKTYIKNNYLKVFAKKYSTTEMSIKAILEKDKCDICGCKPNAIKRHNIDHCHKTGSVRGLLCDSCNTGIGKFKDDTSLLANAIKYLEKYGN